MKKVVVLGGGLAGLATAHYLKKDYLLFEKEPVFGGICRSESVDGFTFDFTGHLLHFRDAATKKFVTGLLRNNLVEHQRNSWIFSQKTYTRYPFQSNTYGLPQKVVEECVTGFVDSLCKYRDAGTTKGLSFADWVLQNFGSGIAKHFMIPYNQKLWQTPPSQLTCEWMGNYVPRPKLEEVLLGAISDQQSKAGYNACFHYPKRGGIQSLIDGISGKVKHKHTGSEVVKISLKDKCVYAKNVGRVEYSKIVSSIPLPELVKMVTPLPGKIVNAVRKLKHTSVLCINVGVEKVDKNKWHWIYYPEKQFPFYRVGFYTSFSPYLAPAKHMSMYVEVSYKPGNKISEDELVRKAVKGLVDSGVISRRDKIKAINLLDIPFSYAIYDRDRTSAVNLIQDFLKQHHIYSISRYGGWKYATMEDAIIEGKSTAEMINFVR